MKLVGAAQPCDVTRRLRPEETAVLAAEHCVRLSVEAIWLFQNVLFENALQAALGQGGNGQRGIDDAG
jgi:hypothetical protein